MRYKSFDEVMTSLRKKGRKVHLLLGNGFSMAYDPEIFSYNALYDFIASLDDKVLSKLFSAIRTKNFELIMQQLDTFLSLLEVFGSDKGLQEQIKNASIKLKQSLLEAIKALHPEHVFKIPEERSVACAEFLNQFINSGGQIYTTNYDLLLYWVLMREEVANSIDGFGREIENPVEASEGETPEWSELRWGINDANQNIFYLHGALQLFDTGTEIIKEQYDEEGYLLENISKRLDAGEYPIFVTAGTGKEKLAHIRHNRYLSHCYDRLTEVDGSLVSFGFNFGEYDEHIIDAINKATHVGRKQPPKLWSIYIGTYSNSDVDHIEKISRAFHAKVHTFDATTANVWGRVS